MSQETLLFPFYDWENHNTTDLQTHKGKKGFLLEKVSSWRVTSHIAPLHDQSFKTFLSASRLSISSSWGWVPFLQITHFVPVSAQPSLNPLQSCLHQLECPAHTSNLTFHFPDLCLLPDLILQMQTPTSLPCGPLGILPPLSHTHTETAYKQVQLFPFHEKTKEQRN